MTTTLDISKAPTGIAGAVPRFAGLDALSPSEDLGESELEWVKLRPWLEEVGYRLRPRYQPGWKGSWHAEGYSGLRLSCEDSCRYLCSGVMDAVRTRDGALVMLKLVKKLSAPGGIDEAEMAMSLVKESASRDDPNHCVQIYETLGIPGDRERIIIVMPLLYELHTTADFETVGEVVDFFKQIFEGLQYMHQQNVAHRDCKFDNILADTAHLYDERPHPLFFGHSYDGLKVLHQRYSRTRRPVRYYYIDFGLSRRYSSRTGNTEPSPWGAILYQVPEFQVPLNTPTNPFPVDIYMLGMMIRQNYLEDMIRNNKVLVGRRINLEWMESLAHAMTVDDPKARPTIEEVIEKFNTAVKTLGSWKLRAPAHRSDRGLSTVQKARHWIIQASRIVRFIPAVPNPPPRPLTPVF